MTKKEQSAVTPARGEDYAEWYQQVIKAADLAETSPVRGCMVIKPWGYALWENMRAALDRMFRDTGHVNAYFPLFIPLSFLQKEAEHVEGFAKECAVVTHHRLEADADGKLVPAGPLDEPLVVRPTSETIIGAMYARWVQSYRDLPVLINQWANVVRWEMRTRMFLRTTEFLWQEGHTAHETRDEAWDETLRMLDVYRRFAEEFMAIPVITGEKTAAERFPGAVNTFCIEAMMQDRKALQAGTSHFLGQNFAKASEIAYQTRDGGREFAWTTSWGVSTRLIGGMVMVHGDDNGMIMPPRLAPAHVVVLPIVRNDGDRQSIMTYCDALAMALRERAYDGAPVRVEIDTRDMNAGEKSWEWIKKGIPVRVEVGPRDIAQNAVFVGRRDKPPREKTTQPRDAFVDGIAGLLADIQMSLLSRARAFREENTVVIDSLDRFRSFFTPANPEKPEIHAGFAMAHWCGADACEKSVNDELSVTIRCIPTGRGEAGKGACVVCGAPSDGRVVFAKAY
jgi:prolyl-tRNA synthetase